MGCFDREFLNDEFREDDFGRRCGCGCDDRFVEELNFDRRRRRGCCLCNVLGFNRRRPRNCFSRERLFFERERGCFH